MDNAANYIKVYPTHLVWPPKPKLPVLVRPFIQRLGTRVGSVIFRCFFFFFSSHGVAN